MSTGWVKLRIDTDPPRPAPTMVQRVHQMILDDLRRPSPLMSFTLSDEPAHVHEYRRSLRREQHRIEAAAEERDRAIEVERADALVAQLTGRLAQVAAIHYRDEDGLCRGCAFYDYDGALDYELWPCATVDALIDDETPTKENN